MKLLAGLVVSVALFAGVHALRDPDSQRTQAETASSSTFRLIANGNEGNCAVTRGASISDGLSLLTVAPNCRRLLPGIERAKFWREQQDGTVAFSADGVDPIVTFSVADGDGYESYAPATPLLSLAAAGDPKTDD